MLDLIKPGEQPKTPVILQRLSEDGICLLTGVTENLTYMPVDTNVNNILPSNMACISVGVAEKVSFTCYYHVTLQNNFKIIFDTPPLFKAYNLAIIENFEELPPPSAETGDAIIKLFEVLTKKHVKGIHSIEELSKGVTIDNAQFQASLLRTLAKKAQNQSKSKIITNSNLGIVK